MKFSTEIMAKVADLLTNEIIQVLGPEAALMGVEDGLRELLRQVGNQALGKYLSRAEVAPAGQVVCPCGASAPRLARRAAKAISVFGKISYQRQYYLCRRCGQGQCPLDRRVGIEPGEVTPALAKLMALSGVEVAFEEAGCWMEQFLLFRLSDNTIRKETERFGELQAAREAEWQEHSQDEQHLRRRAACTLRWTGRWRLCKANGAN